MVLVDTNKNRAIVDLTIGELEDLRTGAAYMSIHTEDSELQATGKNFYKAIGDIIAEIKKRQLSDEEALYKFLEGEIGFQDVIDITGKAPKEIME